jgi:predicted HTH domain antitoxin
MKGSQFIEKLPVRLRYNSFSKRYYRNEEKSKRRKTMGAMLSLEVPQDVLESARMSAADLKTELALALYAQQRLSIGKARELAGMSLWEFRQLLASRHIAPHYDENDLTEDIKALRELNRL